VDAVSNVIVQNNPTSLTIILNRPEAINSLTVEMIDCITSALRQALHDESIQFVLIFGRGTKGFCAGGDIKKLYQASVSSDSNYIKEFYSKEYALDYLIHTFPKPVIVFAHGITMGGGMGIAAGATRVVVTEHTVMAMPESRIGFFPDVGATGWLFTKCRKGYPHYLALTGDTLIGGECVHVGLAHYQVLSHTLTYLIKKLETLVLHTTDVVDMLDEVIKKYSIPAHSDNTHKDRCVAQYFDDKPLNSILHSLAQCTNEQELCNGVFTRVAERSPTSLVMTHLLLKANQGKPLDEVFARELKAAVFMTQHHDYREGVRARIIDKDNAPQWKPAKIEDVDIGKIREVIDA
jgi:enoyl-CoA hydratase/carnithine racemase